MVDPRYPEDLGEFTVQRAEPGEEFVRLREDFLLGFGYQTARAYWNDLQSWWEWAEPRGKDMLNLSEQDIKQYAALLRRRKYAESTIRRRMTALRGFMAHAACHTRTPCSFTEGPG